MVLRDPVRFDEIIDKIAQRARMPNAAARTSSQFVDQEVVTTARTSSPTTPGKRKLSEREVEVTRDAAAGLSVKESALSLFLSSDTVKTHRAHILDVLDAKNMTHAAVICLRSGIIT